MGRGPTAYFLFTSEHRAAAKAELEAQGTAHKVSDVAKLIGAKWGALSDEEKQQYKERAQRMAEAAAATAAEEQQQGPGGEGGDAAAEEGGGAATTAGSAAPPPFGFPLGSVKRIVMLDEEVQRLSADALRAISKATELFVGQLAVGALEHAVAGKKKNFKQADVAHVAARDRRLLDMGLKDILDQLAAAAGSGAAEAENASKRSNKRQKQQEAAAAGTRQITAFFGAAAT